MLIRCLLPIFALSALGSAFAADKPSPVGDYEITNDFLTVSAGIEARGADGFHGSFSTSTTRGCSGDADMPGKRIAPTEILFSKKDETGNTCKIRARFSSDFKTLNLEETDCVYWHGASCEFSGELKRVGR